MEQTNPQPEQTYIFEDVEVMLTGRKATKVLTSGRHSELVEITPVDQMNGRWKKWVVQSAMYTVEV